jgi:hypothetical protein
VASAGVAVADVPAQFAVLNYNGPADPNVNGARLSVLYGKNASVRGADFGLLSISETASLSGAAFILGISKVTGDMNGGAAFSLVNYHEGNDTGLNAAFINLCHSAERGVEFGFVNIASGNTMLDFGGLNVSDSSKVQIGFINVTRKIEGVQIGFLNMAENGFFPFFPFFNFPK